MTPEKTLVERLRYGEACEGNQCRVRNAESGCICAEAATAIELAQTEIKGHMRVKDDLQARIAELEKLLRECLEMANNWPGIAYSYDLEGRCLDALKDRA